MSIFLSSHFFELLLLNHFSLVVMREAKILILLLFILLNRVSAQCTGGTNNGALSPAPSAAWQTMTWPVGDFYYTFNVPSASCYPQYEFSFCDNGGSASFDTQITILDNTGTSVAYNDDNCSLQSKVLWTPSSPGTYRVRVTRFSCAATTATSTLAYRYVATYTNTPNYTLIGNATTNNTCTVLTPNTASQRGCVWDVNSTLNFTSNFSYDFTINLGNNDGGADGMAFVIQNAPSGRCACGSVGGALGAGGITNSLIVEIDTYINTEDRDDFSTNFIGCAGTEDPDHIDMWLNGNVNPDLDFNCNTTGAGERPVIPSAVRLQNPPGTNYNIENGLDHILRVAWTPGAPGTISASILNTALSTTYAVASTTLNPITVFGTNTPYFGFTGSTGGLSNQQSFCNPLQLLPIELLSFEATCNDNNSIDVNWSTAVEINSKLFELERSTDAIHYTKVAEYHTAGNTSQVQKYHFSDVATENNTYYYRLKHIDEGGYVHYQKTIASANNSCFELAQYIEVYPNPTSDMLNVSVGNLKNSVIEILNDKGQLVYKSDLINTSNQNIITISTNEFANGIYAVRVLSDYKTIVKKLVVNR